VVRGRSEIVEEVSSLVGVSHASIITEPQAISSLGSDFFQIVWNLLFVEDVREGSTEDGASPVCQ
jgi:hypothetical protein